MFVEGKSCSPNRWYIMTTAWVGGASALTSLVSGDMLMLKVLKIIAENANIMRCNIPYAFFYHNRLEHEWFTKT